MKGYWRDPLTEQANLEYCRAMRAGATDVNMVAAAVRIAGTALGAKDSKQCARQVAAHLKVTRASVYRWIDQGHMRRVALETALELSRLSGVSPNDLAASPKSR